SCVASESRETTGCFTFRFTNRKATSGCWTCGNEYAGLSLPVREADGGIKPGVSFEPREHAANKFGRAREAAGSPQIYLSSNSISFATRNSMNSSRKEIFW